MSAADLVRVLTDVLFLIVFAAVLRTALVVRTRVSVNTALLFGAIAFVIAQSQVAGLLGPSAAALGALSGFALLALPYLQLRLVDDFAGVPRAIGWTCLCGLAIGAVLVPIAVFGLVDLRPIAAVLIAAAVLYFFGFGAYAAFAFAREAGRSRGVGRRRMFAAATGALALSMTLLAATTVQVFGNAVTTALTMGLGLLSAAGYFVAFAPPALLRSAWREPSLRTFLANAAAISPLQPRAALVSEVETAVVSATGARSAHVFVADSDATKLTAATAVDAETTAAAEAVFASQRRAFFVRGARGILAAPITGRGKRIGVLVLVARRAPLFASDDLDLAQLLADQAAIVLDGARIYADLATANKELTTATRVKSEFLANMSHELRTPLNAILGFSGLLAEQIGGSITDRQRRFLTNIAEAGEHLLQLINDVLDISKVEAGKLELRPEVVKLELLLEPVCAAARTAAQAKGVAFETEPANGASVFIDQTRARQILFNLLSNAVKFTPSGGIVRLWARLNGPDLAIGVTDSGIGIPSDARERVFGVFERFHEGRAEAGGTGLGLALTKRLVEEMRGTITFESEEGRGTTFRVVLPDVHAEPVAGERILVVEDERHDADLIVAVAAAIDLRAEIVRGVTDGRAALARHRPLGVVLDMHLPDGRGDELLGDLRRSGIPVIVVTVETNPATALAQGADDYLTKPIDRGRLETWLKRLDRSTGGAPQRAQRANSHR
ncbi:MAG: response regulator [Chloroflexi bacterium]|nr:MAG: response regulator [Chloroflexota bacterium]